VSEALARTLEVYERRALEWERRREPRTDAASAFTRAVAAAGVPGAVADLGCGPGWHLPHLPGGTVALDATAAMLDLVPRHASGAPRVRGDLRRLPFATASLAAAWAERSYVHLPRAWVPLALRELHRCVAVGGTVHLGLFAGDDEWVAPDDDEFGGRWFSAWPRDLLGAVLEGAGFTVRGEEARPDGPVEHLSLSVRRERTIADTVGPGMRLLLVGLNPSLVAADAGVGFHRRGNRAWPALLAAGLATVDRDPVDLLVRHRIGMTDLVKRASPRAGELSAAEYAHGVERLERLCAWLRPGAVCVLGLTGWRRAVDPDAVAGPQPGRLGGRRVHLMPNPSGANAHTTLDELVEHLTEALGSAEDPGVPRDWPS